MSQEIADIQEEQRAHAEASRRTPLLGRRDHADDRNAHGHQAQRLAAVFAEMGIDGPGQDHGRRTDPEEA